MTSAADRWRHKVLQRRHSPDKRRYTVGLAREYDLKLQQQGYPGQPLEALFELLGPDGSLLDVGGGTGLWAIPTARRGHRVTLVDPGEAMRSVLADRLRAEPEAAERIRVVPLPWEETEVETHDVVLCSHAMYGMPEIEAALEAMERSAAHSVALYVRTSRWPGRQSRELIKALGSRLLPTCNWTDLRAVLDERGTEYEARELRQKVCRAGVFPEAVAWLEERIAREPDDDDPDEAVDVWVTWRGGE